MREVGAVEISSFPEHCPMRESSLDSDPYPGRIEQSSEYGHPRVIHQLETFEITEKGRGIRPGP